MEKIGVAEQLFFAPHNFFAAHRHRIQRCIADFSGEFLAPLLDNRIARIRLAVDRMTEAHDLVFTREHTHYL